MTSQAPNPLPNTIPKGTKFCIGSDIYELLTVGIRGSLHNLFGPVFIYVGDVKHLLTGNNISGYNIYAHSIDWETVNNIKNSSDTTDTDSCEETKKDIKYCLWCNNQLEINQNNNFCVIGKVYCEEYYKALEQRMKIDFREPSEALESEKESVVRWVKNLWKIR
jgi:hypothetical protein